MVPPVTAMKHLIPALCFACLALSPLTAQEEQPPEDGAVPAAAESPPAQDTVIPHAYDTVRYQGTWGNNPFLRVTVVTDGPKVVWSQDWALAGMYKSTTGKITISLQNKQTSEFKRVTSEDTDGSEFKLVKANFNRNRTEASAEISKGNETATIKYDDNLTSRPVTINNTLKAATGGQPGNPNIPGGVQPGNPNGRPGQPVNVTGTNRNIVQPANAQGFQPNGVGGGVNLGMNPGGQPPGVTPSPGGVVDPTVNPNPPTISRRRQLIPAPVVPQTNPQQ